MPKQIIFCADGTWNGPEEQTHVSATDGADNAGEVPAGQVTNVFKLFANLAGRDSPETLLLRNEQEKALVNESGSVAQVAQYVHGVGDSSNVLAKVLGGTFGMGIIARVVRGYTFISRVYVPGDDIHIVGFSRGAYTARALAGMIGKVGLLNPRAYDPADKTQAYRLGIAAWAKSKSVSLKGAGKLTDLATNMLNFVQGFIAKQLPRDGLIADIPIKSVAVWDTVGSLGIPKYAADGRFDVFRFVDNKLGDNVQNGFHAMALDEQRVDFPVTRWEPRQNVTQVWFVGAHADVGGGYPAAESRHSDIALGWMMNKLAGVGVQFAKPLAYPLNADSLQASIHAPWAKLPFSALLKQPRQVEDGDLIHASVKNRWNVPAPSYRPQSMAKFSTAGIGGLKIDETSFG
jgi:uncharacterized protein (DUF2235 family)